MFVHVGYRVAKQRSSSATFFDPEGGGGRLSLKLRYAFRMALLAAVTAGPEPLPECFLETLSWHIVTVTVFIPQRAFFFCLSGTFECCS